MLEYFYYLFLIDVCNSVAVWPSCALKWIVEQENEHSCASADYNTFFNQSSLWPESLQAIIENNSSIFGQETFRIISS